MNQESSRNPKHRPAAEKAGKPRAGGTPPKRSSGSRATAASHGKSPAKSQLLPDQLARRTENLLPKNRRQIQLQNVPFPSRIPSQQPERRLQTCRQRNPFRQPLHRQTPENGSSMRVRQMQPSAISPRREHRNIRIITMLFRRKNQNGFQRSEKRSPFSAPHWFPCS